jgi:hypothetical protein
MVEVVKMEHTVSSMRFPEMRAEIIGAVRALADRDYQERVWINKIFPHDNFYDDFSMRVHILYDDTNVMSNPSEAVGTFIYENEVASFRELDRSLSPLIDDLDDAEDAVYLADPRWPQVVQAAKDALQILQTNQQAWS